MRPCGLYGEVWGSTEVIVRSGIDAGAMKVAAANAVVRGERGDKDGAPSSSNWQLFELSCFDEFSVLEQNFSLAHMALKGRRVDDVGQLGAAPWAFASRFANANHRADERREDAGDDHGYSEKCSQAGAAEHAPHNEAHGRYDEAEHEPAEGVFYRCFFMFGWSRLLVCLDPGSASGTESPRR